MKIHQVMEYFLPTVLSELVLGYMPDNDTKRRFYVRVEDPLYSSRAHLFLFETQYAIDDTLRKIIMIDAKMYNTDLLNVLIKNFIRRTDEPCVKIVQKYTQDKTFKQLINEMNLRVTVSTDLSHILQSLRSRCAFIENTPMFGRIENNCFIEIPIPDPADQMCTILYPAHRKSSLPAHTDNFFLSQLTGEINPLIPYRGYSRKDLESIENI